ncbi:MAG: alcohol dehydrogenase catalytic domain-containing protein [Bryobacteraceae bacterium]
MPIANSPECHACRLGRPNCCERVRVLGVHVDGGMRSVVSNRSTAASSATFSDARLLNRFQPRVQAMTTGVSTGPVPRGVPWSKSMNIARRGRQSRSLQ